MITLVLASFVYSIRFFFVDYYEQYLRNTILENMFICL